LDKLNDIQTGELRLELLNINGIGPETADSILLYAFNRPVFVIDAYTRRAMARIGITDMNASYKELQELFENNLPEDVKLFNDFHAQFVMLGKYYCRVKTGCGGCPLEVVCLTMQLPGFDESGLRNC